MDDMSMRYAHCEGHTDVCYDDSGRYLITGGTDGDIRVYDGFEDDDPKTHHMGEEVNAIAFKENKLYLSTDANAVVPYGFPDMNCDGTLLQFIISVYHISCSENGRYIAAGGGDFMIKVYDNTSKSFTPFRGHEAPILSLALDPAGIYLASSSCDGSVKVWQLSDSTCIQTWKMFKKSNDMCNSETLCRLQWHPKNGKHLVIPVDKELKFYDRDSWDLAFSLTDDAITEVLSLCSFSNCGSYIAAAATDGLIVVWNVKQKTCIAKRPHPKKIKVCSLVWNPSGKKELAFCDIEGQLGLFNDICEVKNKEEVLKSVLPYIGDEANDAFDVHIKDPEITSTQHSDQEMMNDDNDDDENDNAFDIGAMRAEYEPKIFGTQVNGDVDEASLVKNAPTEPQIKIVEAATTPLQTSFQPSATPIHLDQRFMVWNSIGIVRCYNTEEETSIDVEFHDASVYHPINMNNSRGFTMASLSSEALLMAAPKAEDIPSHLECLHIGTWDSNKEWSMEMPEDEDIEAIVLGLGWAAAATDMRLIRIFTISGVQCEVFCCPGPVVCLAAADNQLAVAYHRGAGIPGEQNLGLMLVKVNLNAQCVCRDYPLPLCSKAYLAWLGFTDEGQLCAVDTSGIVRLLNVMCASKWSPIANTKSHAKGKSDNYFVVGLSEIQQEIRCIPCKGSRYPSLLPRPTVTVLPFSLPFCETTADKGRMEEEQCRASILHKRIKTLLENEYELDSEFATVERKWSDVLLKMFALATRVDREYRALDIAELMPNHRIVQGAIKYATQKHHMALAERLGEVVHKKIMAEAALKTVNNDFEEDFIDVPANNKIYGSSSMENEEEKLQPKPLSRSKFRFSQELSNATDNKLPDDEPSSYQPKDSSLSLLPKSSPTINPFKKQDKSKNIPNGTSKPSSPGLDSALSQTAKRLSMKGMATVAPTEKKTSRQSKLFPQKDKPQNLENNETVPTPKKIGFALYLEENLERIKAENPDTEETDVIKMATQLFRELSPEEKAKYKSNTKKVPEVTNTKTDEDSQPNKRKHNSVETSKNEKTINDSKKSKTSKEENKLSTSTKNKLSMFAFSKSTET